MYGKGAGYWQQQQYGGGHPPTQRLNGGKGSWYGDWAQPAYRSYNKGGRKGKGKGHRWNNDAESLRDLPIDRFIQDDMVIDPWTDLYPKLEKDHPELYEKYARHLTGELNNTTPLN